MLLMTSKSGSKRPAKNAASTNAARWPSSGVWPWDKASESARARSTKACVFWCWACA